MQKFTLCLVLTLITNSILAQSKSDLLTDLKFLNEAVSNGHGVNFKERGVVNLHQVISDAEQIKAETLSAYEYTEWIRKAIFDIGCVHTGIKENPMLTKDTSFRYFPMAVERTSEGFNIANCSDSTLNGQVVLSVNGVSVDQIQDAFSTYRPSDGRTSAFALKYFELLASRFVSEYFNNPASYSIETKSGSHSVQASEKLVRRKAAKRELEKLIENDKNYLTVQDGIAYLRIVSFAKSDIKFAKKVFELIEESNWKDLVIDLRFNTGGDRGAAVAFTKYMVDSVFSYSILQPQLETKKYLNKKGKSYLRLSKLKYNFGNFYRREKTKYGKAFNYKYKPAKKNRFKGNIHVVTDGFTASASTMVTSWLKQYSNAKFYGDQASGGYNGNNGGSFPLVTLPQSKIVLRFPAYRLILDADSDQMEGIVPDELLTPNATIEEVIDVVSN